MAFDPGDSHSVREVLNTVLNASKNALQVQFVVPTDSEEYTGADCTGSNPGKVLTLAAAHYSIRVFKSGLRLSTDAYDYVEASGVITFNVTVNDSEEIIVDPLL